MRDEFWFLKKALGVEEADAADDKPAEPSAADSSVSLTIGNVLYSINDDLASLQADACRAVEPPAGEPLPDFKVVTRQPELQPHVEYGRCGCPSCVAVRRAKEMEQRRLDQLINIGVVNASEQRISAGEVVELVRSPLVRLVIRMEAGQLWRLIAIIGEREVTLAEGQRVEQHWREMKATRSLSPKPGFVTDRVPCLDTELVGAALFRLGVEQLYVALADIAVRPANPRYATP